MLGGWLADRHGGWARACRLVAGARTEQNLRPSQVEVGAGGHNRQRLGSTHMREFCNCSRSDVNRCDCLWGGGYFFLNLAASTVDGDSPSGAETAKCVVEAARDDDELGRHSAVEIRPRNLAVL